MDLRPRVLLKVSAGDGGQVLAELDTEDTVAAAGHRRRCLARAAADLEYPASGPYSGERDDVFEEVIGIPGTRLVVEHSRLVEGALEPIPVVGHGLALENVPQRAEADEQDDSVFRERDDGIRDPGLLACQRA